MKNNTIAILYFFAGLCFFLTTFLTKNPVYLALGFCFITLGIINNKKKNK